MKGNSYISAGAAEGDRYDSLAILICYIIIRVWHPYCYQSGWSRDPELFCAAQGVLSMIDRVMSLYQQYYALAASWYQGADMLTQYLIIIVSGIVALLLSMAMFLSRITK